MTDKDECTCSAAPKLIFACSGAADVGAVADQAARRLNIDGVGKMFCTVGLGGRVSPILNTTKAASEILAIDGCPLDCVKNSLEQAGFSSYIHLRVTDLGMEKGKTLIDEVNITTVADQGKSLLNQT